jgi:hypothetical protein
MKQAVEMVSGGTICLPMFMKISTGIQAILSLRMSNLKQCNVGVTDDRNVLYMPLK